MAPTWAISLLVVVGLEFFLSSATTVSTALSMPVRSLLVAIAKLPWSATGEHPVIDALARLRELYARGARSLPDAVAVPRLESVWRDAIDGYDRERAFRALEVAALFALRRSERNGSVWIEHSLTFRGRERLFPSTEHWHTEAKRHYARLSLPTKAADFLEPLQARVRSGLDAVAAAARAGALRVDDTRDSLLQRDQD